MSTLETQLVLDIAQGDDPEVLAELSGLVPPFLWRFREDPLWLVPPLDQMSGEPGRGFVEELGAENASRGSMLRFAFKMMRLHVDRAVPVVRDTVRPVHDGQTALAGAASRSRGDDEVDKDSTHPEGAWKTPVDVINWVCAAQRGGEKRDDQSCLGRDLIGSFCHQDDDLVEMLDTNLAIYCTLRRRRQVRIPFCSAYPLEIEICYRTTPSLVR